MRSFVLLLGALSGFVCHAADDAQNYPSRPVRLIVPYPPGGGTDVFARVIGLKLAERWGYAVIVDNRAGATGNIGSALVAKAPADGHTLMMNTIALVLSQSIYKSLPFNVTKDFEPIVHIAGVPHILVVNANMPATSVKELIALAKAKPGRLNYASVGVGSPFQMAAELFKVMAGVSMQEIPYQGGGPAITALLGNQVDLAFANLLAALPLVSSGRLKALAVTSAKRSAAAPNVPTLSETDLPGYDLSSWFGIWAPARTARAIIDKINKDVVQVLKTPEVGDRLEREGAEIVAGTPQEFAAYIKSELNKWDKVIKQAGIRAD